MIAAAVYRGDGVTEYAIEDVEDLRAAKRAEGTTWVRANEAGADELALVAEAFEVHALTVEDVQSDVRPKTEEFDQYTFVLLKDAELRRGEQTFQEEIDDTPVGIYIGPDWVVTLSTGTLPANDRVWRSVVAGDERLLERGADFTAYRVVDALVDEYFDILETIEKRIERIEEDVMESTEIDVLEEINTTRRDLLAFRKLAWPTREAVNVLARGDTAQISERSEKYYRDVYDHLVQIVDLIETYRELTSGTRDIYLNTLSQSTNEVMKRLTVVATIVLPLTFVVGVYGMNFSDSPYNMPELGWTFGYPAVVLGMLLVALIMAVYFRERDWF
ncbi:MAG: magnesium/cobalt transporter CorA [Haloferacaceae archaeon]